MHTHTYIHTYTVRVFPSHGLRCHSAHKSDGCKAQEKVHCDEQLGDWDAVSHPTLTQPIPPYSPALYHII